MKRTLFWHLPLATAVIAAAVFGYGLSLRLRGDIGVPVVAEAAARPEAAKADARVLKILILGDSLARGTGDQTGLGIGGNLDAELTQRKIAHERPVNIAVNGARTADLLAQLESANVQRLIAESGVIVVSIGGNDLFGESGGRAAPPEDPEAILDGVVERVSSVVETIRAANPEARVFLVGLYNPFTNLPGGAQVSAAVNEWNWRLLAKVKGDTKLTIVQTSDLFAFRDRLSADRFHPGREGYQLIGRRIAESL